jgi:tryptophan halogenase
MENDILESLRTFKSSQKAFNSKTPYYQNLEVDSTNIYTNVGVIGGGLAGYLTAIAFKKFFNIPVTVIESPNIPIIGVGEATTPILHDYLFDVLELDREEFFREVEPTWKLGIKFFWGKPGDYTFNYPFDSKDILSSLYHNGDIDHCSLNSLLMTNKSSFLMRFNEKDNVRYESLDKHLKYAYHLDNKKFVAYLKRKAEQCGVNFINTEVQHAQLKNDKLEIDHLIDLAGNEHSYDFFIDCSGFRSLLLEKTLKSKYVSFSDSLYNDKAIVTKINNDTLNCYTLAETMDNGWCWTIPTRGEDHLGYVYSSSFCTEDQAIEEIFKKKLGTSKDIKSISFRSGRHEEFIIGNTAAIGNSYSFVEPLESTGVHMIIQEVIMLMNNFINLKGNKTLISFINRDMNAHWDYIRWFLSIHFKFNNKSNTPYWRESRANIDVSGFQHLINLYKEIGFLSYQDTPLREILKYHIHDQIFDVYGIDHILAGQGILPDSTQKISLENSREWQEILKSWRHIVSQTIPVNGDLPLLLDQKLI